MEKLIVAIELKIFFFKMNPIEGQKLRAFHLAIILFFHRCWIWIFFQSCFIPFLERGSGYL